MKSHYSSKSDEQLAILLQRGDEREGAFRELYARHGKRIHAYCLRVLGAPEEADDIFQETFVRFFNAATTERLMTNVPAFLLRIARNLCLNHKRDSRPTVMLQEHDIIQTGHEYDTSELLKLITTALELLDDEHREAFVLRKYNGCSYQEIADITDTTALNARSRVHRAQAKIRSILAPYLADIDAHL
jgi:RNA polymerase sigma-70 factor (ECF subfamily)